MSRVARNKADKQRRILQAATRLFAKRGYHGTAIPLVAAEAQVGAGTIYRFFASKEVLVNEVFRECKRTLRDAILTGVDLSADAAAGFAAFWTVLYRFAREHEQAFRFLELQDHAPYLDEQSRALETAILTPIGAAITRLRADGVFRDDPPLAIAMALIWGAFVGVMKAEQAGYFTVTEVDISAARDACWRAFATEEWRHHQPGATSVSTAEQHP